MEEALEVVVLEVVITAAASTDKLNNTEETMDSTVKRTMVEGDAERMGNGMRTGGEVLHGSA